MRTFGVQAQTLSKSGGGRWGLLSELSTQAATHAVKSSHLP